jgi:tetratricopeptide (TPR) repeat protein
MPDHFQRSQVLVNQGRYDLAEKELRQALSLEPDYAPAHGLLAVCLSEKKLYAEALKELGLAIALHPAYPKFHFIRSGILRQQHNLDAATQAILEALRLNPDNTDFYAQLGSFQYDQQKYIEALKSADQGLSIDAEHVWSMNLRLLTLLKLGRIARAEADINGALALAPDHSFPHAAKGWILLHQNQIPAAMNSFKEALRLDPSLEWARSGLLEALKARNWLYRSFLWVELVQLRLTTWQKVVFAALLVLPQTRAILILPLLFIAFSNPLFDPYGRLVLSQKEKTQNQWFLVMLLSLIPSVLLYGITQKLQWFLLVPTLLPVAYCAHGLLSSSFNRLERIQFAVSLPFSPIPFLFVAPFIFPKHADLFWNLAWGSIIFAVVFGIASIFLGAMGLTLYLWIRKRFHLNAKK